MINWKVRFKNPMFYVQILAAVFAPILAYMGLTAQELSSWSIVGHALLTAISNPYVLVMVAVSVYNAVVDPTTAGVGDSARAMKYNSPNSIKE